MKRKIDKVVDAVVVVSAAVFALMVIGVCFFSFAFLIAMI